MVDVQDHLMAVLGTPDREGPHGTR
jgi:hypothetical protein